VTGWRLLRKKYRDKEDELAEAVRNGRWMDFQRICKAKNLRLHYGQKANQYGELKPYFAGLVIDGQFIDATSEWRPKWLKTRLPEGGRELALKYQENQNPAAPDPIIPVSAPVSRVRWVDWPPPVLDDPYFLLLAA